MTKLDGTAKGGILVALAHRFALPFISSAWQSIAICNPSMRTRSQALTGT